MTTDLKGADPELTRIAAENLKRDERLLLIRDTGKRTVETRFWNANGGLIIHRIVNIPPKAKKILLN